MPSRASLLITECGMGISRNMCTIPLLGTGTWVTKTRRNEDVTEGLSHTGECWLISFRSPMLQSAHHTCCLISPRAIRTFSWQAVRFHVMQRAIQKYSVGDQGAYRDGSLRALHRNFDFFTGHHGIRIEGEFVPIHTRGAVFALRSS